MSRCAINASGKCKENVINVKRIPNRDFTWVRRQWEPKTKTHAGNVLIVWIIRDGTHDRDNIRNQWTKLNQNNDKSTKGQNVCVYNTNN